uniref:EOG090X08E0 n=1 Tax=Alona affinis TaxID=381656 RepID=A0A9N6WP23_9CRUS|nr:EOG090X08E0 [Alona affinis]
MDVMDATLKKTIGYFSGFLGSVTKTAGGNSNSTVTKLEKELVLQAKSTADLAVKEMQSLVRAGHPALKLAGLSGAAAVILGAYGAHDNVSKRKMTRHARNSTAGSVYTYHEKKRDAQQSGYGSHSQRFSKDSIKEFDCCSLTLQPCRNPVVSSDGYLYDKEAILEYYINKKKEIARQLKEYEKQNKRDENEKNELKAAAHRSQVEKFIATEKGESLPSDAKPSTSTGTLSNMADGKAKELPSFWVPAMTPDSKRVILPKPDTTIYCPVSGKVLKMKDLIDVKFTLAPNDEPGKSIISRQVRYMCPVTRDILGNSVPCVILKPTGDVVTTECYEKLIKKDMLHPLTGVKLKESDVIPVELDSRASMSNSKQLKPVLI